MANSFIYIAKTEIASSGTISTITFSGIPSNFKDLVIKGLARTSAASVVDNLRLRVNGLSTSIYSYRYLDSNGSATGAGEQYNQTGVWANSAANGGTSSSDIFAYSEWYIANYSTTLANKPGYVLSAQESTTTTKYLTTTAFTIATNQAISSLTIEANSGLFTANTSFYLYGMNNN